jgi:hypothetical protein
MKDWKGWPWDTATLSSKLLSVSDYNHMAYRAVQTVQRSVDDAVGTVCRLLAGRGPPTATHPWGQEYRLSPLLDVTADEVTHIRQDVDSVIIVVKGALALETGLDAVAVPNPLLSLTKSNHIKTTLHENGPLVSLHTIPNFCIGRVGRKGKVLAMLPALHSNNTATGEQVPAHLLARFYDRGVRPALQQEDPGYTQIPVSYQSATELQRDAAGHFHEHTFTISGPLVSQVMKNAQARMAHDPLFCGLFFMLEMKGLKGEGGVALGEDNRASIIKHALRDINMETVRDELNTIYLDVAMEFYNPNALMRARQSSHEDILRWIFPHMSHHSATTSASRLTVDHYAQLDKIAGFRGTTSGNGAGGVVYMQLYFTDKTYYIAVGHSNTFSAMAAKRIRPETLPTVNARLKAMRRLIAEAVDNPHTDANRRVEGAVRVELRMPLAQALTNFLIAPTQEQMKIWFLPFNPKDLMYVLAVLSQHVFIDPFIQQLYVVQAVWRSHCAGHSGTGTH